MYWDKEEEWTDPKGVARKGRFKRLPSTEEIGVAEIPQGVVPKEMLTYGLGIADAFVEVLKIAEENGLGNNTEALEVVAEGVGTAFARPTLVVSDER
jgi:hypothetical protein